MLLLRLGLAASSFKRSTFNYTAARAGSPTRIGKGIITEHLACTCKRVIAIEKDPSHVVWLKQIFACQSNVTIRGGDFLTDRLPCIPYKVFANIPFNITSAIITRLTTVTHPPQDAYLIMQKKAAQMYLGKPDETLRALLLKPWLEVEILHRFRRRDFVPAPRVDVVLLCLHKRGLPLVNRRNSQVFRDFVVYAFTAWEPTLKTALKGIFTHQQLKHIQSGLGINLNAPPTSVKFEQWLSLFNLFLEAGSPDALRTVSGSEKHLIRQQKRLQKIHRTRLAG